MTATDSILERTRREGFAQGSKFEQEFRGQLTQCAYDDGFMTAREEAEALYPSKFKWFVIGAVTTIAVELVTFWLYIAS